MMHLPLFSLVNAQVLKSVMKLCTPDNGRLKLYIPYAQIIVMERLMGIHGESKKNCHLILYMISTVKSIW